MSSPINPLVLIFDLDETLFLAKLWEQPPKSLSASSANVLSQSTDGVIENPVAMSDEENEFHLERVTAINRHIMKGIFEKIFHVMQKAKKMNTNTPIAVKVITAASYHEPYVKKFFDKFYADNSELFSKEEFPIEYYNRFDLIDTGSIETEQTKGQFLDSRKANLIDDKFPEWKKQMPGLIKKRVFLIDNADYNTETVKLLGYSSIHYATTHEERLEGKTFTKLGSEAISRLINLINSVDEALSGQKSNIMQNVGETKSKPVPPPKPKFNRPLPKPPIKLNKPTSKQSEKEEVKINKNVDDLLKKLGDFEDVSDPNLADILNEFDKALEKLKALDVLENKENPS